MARDMTTMFDEMRILADKHAELHADQARLQTEQEKERAELEWAWRLRWRYLIG
jgi:hypothetical protein